MRAVGSGRLVAHTIGGGGGRCAVHGPGRSGDDPGEADDISPHHRQRTTKRVVPRRFPG